MKRVIAAVVVAAGVVSAGGAAGAAEECMTTTVGVNACASVTETTPIVAAVVGTTPLGTFDVHLGFVLSAFPGSDCDYTHVGSVCLPRLFPGVYEIHAMTNTRQGTFGVHAVGSPAPCLFNCVYDVDVEGGAVVRRSMRVCYDVSRGVGC